MSRRFISLVVASHLAVILAGFWFGRPSDGGAPRPPDEPLAVPNKRPLRPPAPVTTAAASFQSTEGWSAREFTAAWRALGRTPLSKPERVKIRREMLANWAARDLPSALEATFDEQWNDESSDEDLRTTLFGVFYRPFVADPEGTWDLIASGRFGINTGLLRHLWTQTAGEEDPLVLAARIGDLPPEYLQEGLNACGAQLYDDTTREAAFRILSKLPEGVLTARQLEAFTKPRKK